MSKKVCLFFIICFLLPLSGKTQGFVKSEKEDFEWRVIGRALFDGGAFFSDSTEMGNGVVINDLRLGVVMRFLTNWQGRVEIGFSESKVSLKDVYVAYHQGVHTLRAGHYFELFGIENRVATTTYRLMNMSVTNSTFGDRRKIGFSYMYDKLRWTVAGGIFSDSDVDNNKGLNEGYTLVGKWVGRPVFDEDKLLHIGLSARFSEHDKAERQELIYKAGAPTNVLKKDENQFLRASVTDMINQWRWGTDVILLYKGAYLQSECLVAHVNRAGAPDYTGKGGYVQVGYLLLGDRKYTYNRAQGWVDNPAASNLELLFRYNVTSMNDRKAEIMGGKEQDITLGANYFINKYVAVRLNYTYMVTDKYAVNGKESVNFIQGRLQFSF